MATRVQKMSSGDAATAAMRGLAASMGLRSGVTQRVTATDEAQIIPASVKTGVDEIDAVQVLITCEGNELRFAFGTDPTQDAEPVGHVLIAGQSYLIEGQRDIENFRLVNKTTGATAVLQMTPRF